MLRRSRLLTLTILLAALVVAAPAGAVPTVGWPGDAGTPPDLPYPTVYMESQGWWHQGDASASKPGGSQAGHGDWAHTSNHVHYGLAFPQGELAKIIDGKWVFPGVIRLHNMHADPGKANFARGGFIEVGNSSSGVKNSLGWNPSAADEMRLFTRYQTANPAATGKKQARFTVDTTSPFGKRFYESTGWYGYLSGTPAAAPATCRGWYESTDYTNINWKTPFRATSLAKQFQTINYSTAQGGNFPFAYANANLHAGDKGTVIFEATSPRTSGSFVIPSGATSVLLGVWEKGSDGWNAGVCRIPVGS